MRIEKAVGFLIGIFLVSACLMFLGYKLNNPLGLNFCIPFGAALLGISGGLLLERLKIIDIQGELKNSISKIGLGFGSEKEKIDAFLTRWGDKIHLYHITQHWDADLGKARNYWRYAILDFSESKKMGQLFCTGEWLRLPKQKEYIRYSTELGLRGNNRITIVMKEEEEGKDCPLLMFEEKETAESMIQSGLVFHETLAGEFTINAALLSKTKLFEEDKYGMAIVEDSATKEDIKSKDSVNSTFKKYSKVWIENNKKHNLQPNLEKVLLGIKD